MDPMTRSSVDEFCLPHDTTAPGLARAHVAAVLNTWRAPEDAVLIASELVTNAVQHGIPPIALRLSMKPSCARIIVTNAPMASATQPRIVAAGADQPDGRGLAIVAALSTDWGWESDDNSMSVWAEVADTAGSSG